VNQCPEIKILNRKGAKGATSKLVAKGGLNFRARFGVGREGVSLLADGSCPIR